MNIYLKYPFDLSLLNQEPLIKLKYLFFLVSLPKYEIVNLDVPFCFDLLKKYHYQNPKVLLLKRKTTSIKIFFYLMRVTNNNVYFTFK